MYADNEKKLVAVLNRQIPLPQQMMALGHMAVGLSSLYPIIESMHFHCYEDADGGLHPAISHFPFIVLEARNSDQIHALRKAAREAGLRYNDFVNTMIGTSAEEQLQATRSTRESDLEYFGIVLFGPSEVLAPLTRRFSLLR
jgi:Protein of unknown function (DUF2000)